jgi:hypothetical protein
VTDDTQNRYGGNRNVWRKVYGYSRQKPKIVTFVDTASSKSLTVDLNTYYKHRDYFIVDKVILPITSSTPIVVLAEYDEGLINFNNETQKIGNFNFTFSNIPFVVLTIEPSGDNTDNINLFGTGSPTTNYFTASLSAPFSGSIRYRAVYSSTYPTQVTSSYSGSAFYVYGGEINASNAVDYTASYSIPGGTLEYRATSFDVNLNNTADVSLINTNLSNTESDNTISAPFTNKIYFIISSQ